VNHPLIPLNLVEETELLEALEWDEEALASLIERCSSALDGVKTGLQASRVLAELQSEITSEWGQRVSQLAITLLLKRTIQYSTEEIEA
jgi:hypothetical protein